MSHKSLTEAAAEVLNKSRVDSVHEPMHKLGPQPLGNIVDLGGATHENPEGNAVGVVTAAHRPQTNPPGVQPSADTDEPMHKLTSAGGGREEAAKTSDQKAGEKTSPEDNNGPGVSTAGHEYMKPTKKAPGSSNEEVELTDEELAEAKKEKWEKMKDKMKKKDCKEDIDAILSGQTFSEEFRTKLTTIFETAVITRAVEVAQELETEILAAAEESVDEIATEMEESVDAFLTSMVEDWKEENRVAIETGLKSELVEEFLSGLRNLFEEHYIDMPAEKVDVVESLTAEIAELTDKLNNSLNSNVELSKKINEAKKQEILVQTCEGLTATQSAKVKTLAEGVEFVTADDYAKKLKTIRESYFNKVKQDNQQPAAVNQIALAEGEAPAQTEEISPLMETYVNAIARTNF
jgi:intracellular sulfur oxidation DsrE/DsrF family protein